MQFGSHIYGTNTPSSDLDFKAIYIPPAQDILLQRVKETRVESTKELKTARNQAGDVDTETFSLQQYLKLLLEGQTVAVDMLFTPERFWIGQPMSQWAEIQGNRGQFLHKGYSAFAGYCRQQANKYGIKGSRVNAVRSVLEWLSGLPSEDKIGEHWDIDWNARTVEHVAMVECRAPNGRMESHLEVCNRKVPFHARVKYARQVFQKIFDEYGHRALLAEKHEGVDWKALMHAVRICRQSKELLLTGQVIFPRPDAAELLQIRTGQRPYKEVAEMIEQGLIGMEDASKASPLPEKPNFELAEQIVLSAYRNQVTQTC